MEGQVRWFYGVELGLLKGIVLSETLDATDLMQSFEIGTLDRWNGAQWETISVAGGMKRSRPRYRRETKERTSRSTRRSEVSEAAGREDEEEKDEG